MMPQLHHQTYLPQLILCEFLSHVSATHYITRHYHGGEETLTLTPNTSSPVQREPYKGCKSQFCVQITPNNPEMITYSVFSDTLLQSAASRQGWLRYGGLHKLFSLLNCPVESWSVWDWNVLIRGHYRQIVSSCQGGQPGLPVGAVTGPAIIWVHFRQTFPIPTEPLTDWCGHHDWPINFQFLGLNYTMSFDHHPRIVTHINTSISRVTPEMARIELETVCDEAVAPTQICQ